MPLPAGVDMNVEFNLKLYHELALFQNDFFEDNKEWRNTDSAFRTALHAVADSLDLEYEFSHYSGVARICRRAVSGNSVEEQMLHPEIDLAGLIDYQEPTPMDVDTGDIHAPILSEDLGEVHCNPADLTLHNTQQDASLAVPQIYSNTCHSNLSTQNLCSWENGGLGDFETNLREARSISMPVQETSYPSTSSQPLSQCLNDDLFASQFPTQTNSEIGNKRRKISSETDPIFTSSSIKKPESATFINSSKRNTNQFQTLPGLFSTLVETDIQTVETESQIGPPRRESLYASSASSASNHSYRSESGQLNFMVSTRRRHNAAKNTTAGYDELIFDSSPNTRSEYSGSQTSGRLGRSGPLETATRIAQKAMRELKACWRCKFSRKCCDAEKPCRLCTKTSNRFDAIGCRRGSIKENMKPLALCPARHSANKVDFPGSEGLTPDILEANQHLFRISTAKSRHLMHVGTLASIFCKDRDVWPPLWVTQPFPVPCFQGSRYSTLKSKHSASLFPLNECILDIIWCFGEIDFQPCSNIRRGLGGQDNFTCLLYEAALCQSETNADQLIAQSLICLRSCLEAIHTERAVRLGKSSHKYCNQQKCAVICIEKVYGDIEGYLKELSRVFFQTDLSDKKAWWPSMFWSFWIQATVRELLMRLRSYSPLGNSEYLYLPVRLFIANSGDFDPIANGKDASTIACSRFRDVLSDRIQTMSIPMASKAYLEAIFEFHKEEKDDVLRIARESGIKKVFVEFFLKSQ